MRFRMECSINLHEETVPECDGCSRQFETIKNKKICSINKYPRVEWWSGEICPQATHIKKNPEEDPSEDP
jgi:predicted amidophosphoribosyltransferase